ncbi:MAG: MFS transporter [Candidatus Aenigmarchaeota archaeon]|nr:MFS transporter [Candidatus Aenigmarchaeota archaeon]
MKTDQKMPAAGIKSSNKNPPNVIAAADEKTKRSLEASIQEGVFNSASTSIISTYATPFALALGAGSAEIGLLSSAQSLAGTAAQLPGAWLTEKFSRKSIWLFSQIFGKIFLWLPVIVLPFLGAANAVLIFIILLAATAFFQSLRTPAWSSLMGDIVPKDTRGRYFGRRNLYAGIAGIIAAGIGGYIVTLWGFSLVFSVAVALSIVSIFLFMRMHEPAFRRVFHYRHKIYFRPSDIKTAFVVNRNFTVFTLAMAAVYFSVYLSSPFFTVFMLRDLNIGYLWFSAAVVLNALVSTIFQPYWGRLSDHYGERSILIISGMLISVIPFIYLFVSEPFHVIFAEIFSGFAWAGFEIVAFNFLLAATPAQRRPHYIANHVFFRGIATVLGAALGGFLATIFEGSSLFWISGLQLLFALSFATRLGSVLLFLRVNDPEVRQTDILPVRYVLWRTMAVEPAMGLKNIITFTFRSSFDRDAEYLKAIRKNRLQTAKERKKEEIIEGTSAAFEKEEVENKKTEGDNKDRKPNNK